MTHEEFVVARRQDLLDVSVLDRAVLMLMLHPYSRFPSGYRYGYLSGLSVWLLCFLLGIGSLIWWNIWLALVFFPLGFFIRRVLKQSAVDIIIKHAFDDKEFYEVAVRSRVIVVTQRNR